MAVSQKEKAARLIILKENPLTFRHFSRTAYRVATNLNKHEACQDLEKSKSSEHGISHATGADFGFSGLTG